MWVGSGDQPRDQDRDDQKQDARHREHDAKIVVSQTGGADADHEACARRHRRESGGDAPRCTELAFDQAAEGARDDREHGPDGAGADAGTPLHDDDRHAGARSEKQRRRKGEFLHARPEPRRNADQPCSEGG